MSVFKRIASIVCAVCALVETVIFYVILWAPVGSNLVFALRDNPLLLVLASLVVFLAFCGAVWGVVRLALVFRHAAVRLSTSQAGPISIEQSALVSVAASALGGVSNVAIQDISIDVVPRRDGTALDVSITATPLGTNSLMALADAIQLTCKRALEAFTEHEVSNVTVKFAESRRRGESMSAGPEVTPVQVADLDVPAVASDDVPGAP